MGFPEKVAQVRDPHTRAALKELGLSSAAALTVLTDNSAGTADNTIAAMPDPADAPASADALREDFVTNIMPPLRNNIADLTAKVNALIALLS
jgi:hypothetical protein